eukprot:TRINITY_DN7637_c1_g1_i1.p1 TRINITY_DN7637_c1_g1~~TRINITY_DN7637_c1_g1_i1.p1  ORF type:complete len:458 (+),score=83.50 TRINITY_DN7637_c1_g1_i1:32-1405(+)
MMVMMMMTFVIFFLLGVLVSPDHHVLAAARPATMTVNGDGYLILNSTTHTLIPNDIAVGNITLTKLSQSITSLQSTISSLNLEYNVRSFGAKGDGVTDDLPAIEAAFAALFNAPSLRGTIYFPAGRYPIFDVIIVAPTRTHNITIRGDGPNSQIMWSEESGAFSIAANAATNLLMKDMRITAVLTDKFNFYAISVSSCVSCIFSGITIEAPAGLGVATFSRGISLRNSVRTQITRFSIMGVFDSGAIDHSAAIYVFGGSQNTITSGYILGSRQETGNSVGIMAAGNTQTLTISSVNIDGTGYGIHSIKQEAGSTSNLNIEVSGGYIMNTDYGIYITDNVRFTVTGTQLLENTQGIIVTGLATVSVGSCMFSGDEGVYLTTGRTMVTGSDFRGIIGNAIYMQNVAASLTASANMFGGGLRAFWLMGNQYLVSNNLCTPAMDDSSVWTGDGVYLNNIGC